MPQWMKFFVFIISHGHTGESVVKGDKDDYGIGECAMGGEVERAGIVQPEEKAQAGYVPIHPISIFICINI